MKFKNFKKQMQDNFNKISKDTNFLFEVDVDKDELWNLYLDSFPNGTNEIFRERREYDCSCCRQFIKNIGNVVAIKNNKIITVWDIETDCSTFKPVVEALSTFIKSKCITDVYVNKFDNIGVDKNFETTGNGDAIEWTHFYLELPHKFVNRGSSSIAEVKGNYRDTKNVFKRSLDEITEDSILTVLELIMSNSLYKGEEWKNILNEFLKYKKAYGKLHTEEDKNMYVWQQSLNAGSVIGRIKNHSIGTLLMNISENMELDLAVRKYEAIVAPTNYKRPKAIFTKKMLEDAQKKIQEMGYMESLGRRYATIDDITINNILFSNKDIAKTEKIDLFSDMMKEVSNKPKKFSKVEEVSIENFANNILPSANEVEVYLENRHNNNMVSLIAPQNKDSKTMFKWNNNFSWAYSGNITDSNMKDNVKSAGGKVDGVLRFSIQWNDEDYNSNDFDAHCIEPNGNQIYYGRKSNYYTTGALDVDIMTPRMNKTAVENITWSDRQRMEEGEYKFFVHNYAHRGGRSGFKAEIEFDGQLYSFEYNKELKNNEKVVVATVKFDKNQGFTIKERLPSSVSSREVWNLKTNDFVPVSTIMFSPNYWDEQDNIGHKHYFFMLKNCVNSESPNGFYNEFLKEELMGHKRVFEALGGKMRVEDVNEQLSGLGFSATKRNELIVKVKGQTERVLKLKF